MYRRPTWFLFLVFSCLLAMAGQPIAVVVARSQVAGTVMQIATAANQSGILAVKFSPDGTNVVSGSQDGTLRVRAAASGREQFSSRAHRGGVTALAYNPSGITLVSTGADSEVRIWNTITRKQDRALQGHEHAVLSVAMRPNGKTIFTSGQDGTVREWDTGSGKLIRIFPHKHTGFVTAVAVSPDGRILAAAGRGGTGSDHVVVLFDLVSDTGKEIGVLQGHVGRINTIAFRDASTLASGGDDATIRLWDIKNPEKPQQSLLKGHRGPVQVLAFSPDGKTLASGAEDRTGGAKVNWLVLWAATASSAQYNLKYTYAYNAVVSALTFSPDGKTLAAGGMDSSIILWSTSAPFQQLRVLQAAVSSVSTTTNTKQTINPKSSAGTTVEIASNDTKQGSGDSISSASEETTSTGASGAAAEAGTGPPILVVTSSVNKFGNYFPEILRGEGFNEFAVLDIASVTSTALSSYDVVILAETPLTGAQVTMFNDWVTTGGNLIAMRPDKQLAGLLGLTDANATLSDRYLLVDTSVAPGNGIVNTTIQYHGTADRYTLNGASSVATLYSDATNATSNPAVTLRSVGTVGGQAAAFTYDLARSVVYIRQGNPAWAGQQRESTRPIRSHHLYYGSAAHDPQPNWVDLNKVGIPSADEQQRLLTNLILLMNSDRKPLPRFWYLPFGKKAAVVMTGDDHGNGGTVSRFDQYKAASPANCVVDNWECIRGTSYIYTNTPISNAQAAAYAADGFEIGMHPNTGCADFTAASLDSDVASQLTNWKAKYTSLPTPSTNRTHCVPWSDWSSTPKVELKHGIRLDTTYYYWPPDWVGNRPGFMNSSALPQRFVDADGAVIDVYQALTQLTDESGQTYPFTIDTLLDRAIGQDGYYGVYTVNAHTDAGYSAESDAVVNSAKTRGVPVVSARQMLTWLDGRNNSSFTSLVWDANSQTLSFTITPGTGAKGLQAMLPTRSGAVQLSSITRGGNSVPLTIQTIKGISYAFFSASADTYIATYAADITPPTVTSSVPASNATGVSAGTSLKATFSEPMDTATISTLTVELRDPQNNLVAATVSYDAATNSAVLQPSSTLKFGATYTAKVKGGAADPRVKDLAGNALTLDYSWSFTTANSECPCTIWSNASTPSRPSVADSNAVELGVKFRSTINGYVSGIRFYKGSGNTGTHTGTLWTNAGQKLATATFTNETASGWQQVSFASPVPITANTVYVASYHTNTGYYAGDSSYFATSGVVKGPLEALQDGVDGGNGVYQYGASQFPANSYRSTNYWVDIVFETSTGPDTTAPTVTRTSPAAGATGVATGTKVTATFSESLDATTINGTTFELRDSANTLIAATVSYDGTSKTASLQPKAALAAAATYTARLKGGSSGVKDLAGNPLAADYSWSFTTAAPTVCPCTIWSTSTTPGVITDPDPSAVELGVKFRSDVDGYITGIRFYKSSMNTGTHVGSFWTSTGQLLAQATFTNETASGWQQVTFATPVAITANTTYIASYHTRTGYYSTDAGYFANTGVDNGPLHALRDGVSGGNGVYNYSGSPAFPNQTYQASNYWVDVVFATQ